MNKAKWILLFSAVFVLGAVLSALSVLPLLALVTIGIAVAVLLLDYERATLIVALYTVFEFLLRTLIARPLSQIPLLFGKSAYSYISGSTPPAFSSYWDELALLFCFGIWLYKWLRYRNEKPYRATPIDISIILFMALATILLFFAAPDFTIGVEGLRVVIQYMLWFFVTAQLLRTPEGAKRIMNILVLSGLLVSLYGIYQFAIGVEIPSRWVDGMEGSVRTRVFSIFTSPNMMAGYLTLLIPIAVGLFFGEKSKRRKLYYAGAIGSMGLSLLFTMARGGWFFCAFALMVYIWLKNKKLFIPAILTMAALFVFCIVFVPSVANRVLYLLSSEYWESSMRGGRVIRAIEGYNLFVSNFWTGMGLGQYGGSVALSHKLNNTVSLDNYYIKTAVEMGIFGLAALLALLYNVMAWCSRALSKIRDEMQKDWARGIVAGLSGVIVFNLTENMLEIPLISSYFWMMAGIVMFLAYGQYRKGRELQPAGTDAAPADCP